MPTSTRPVPDIVVRPAVAADVPALGRLGAELVAVHHAFDARRFFAAEAGTAHGYGEFLGGQIDRPNVILLVAQQAGDVTGYCYAAIEGVDFMALRGPAGALYDLVVDPARRGQGVGHRLLDAMLAALAARGVPQVVLSAAARNAGAQRMFAAAGFRPTMIEMTRELD